MSKNLKILVVEDEALTALELQKKLVSWGYEVIDVVSSGEKAIEKSLELQPDLVLMDILLKGDMTGIDAAREIKSKMEIPIIYLTAYSDDETFEGAKITQPYAYLIKPFQDNELRFAIEMAFYGHERQLELKKSESHYRFLAESTPDMIFIINPDLSVNYVNESSLKYLKKPKDEIIGRSLKEIFPASVFKSQKKTLNDIFRNGKSLCSEDLIIFPDDELWLNTCFKPLKDDNGSVYAIMGISRNVSKFKKIQEELQGKDDFNFDIIESISQPVFYKDKLGLYRACNRAFEELLGLSKEDIIGKTVYDIAPRRMADKYLEMDQKLFETPGAQYYESEVQHVDGSVRDIIFNKITLNDSEGNLKGILGLMVDITSQKRIPNGLQKSKNQQDAVIREMHTCIQKNLKLVSNLMGLQADSINDNNISMMFRENQKRVQVMALMYEKLSFYDDPTHIEFGNYLKSLVSLFINFYKPKGYYIDHQVNAEKINMSMDCAIPLAFIAHELVSNSLKHAFNQDKKGELIVTLEKDSSYWIMGVKDNGVGLPDNFNFLKSENLGFKIVKIILDEVNGELDFKNENGVQFIIRIPKIIDN
ncbi:MAG: PAS domain-containing protein [Methanobacteriaceae archaeon]|nr:PAS domain-containing protein [Methanobacteriaceae archaeon]